MCKMLHIAAACLMAAFAAASLIGLATAAPGQSSAKSACPHVVCIMTLY